MGVKKTWEMKRGMRMRMQQNGNLTSPNAPLLLRPSHPQNAGTGSGSYSTVLTPDEILHGKKDTNELSVGEDDFFVVKKKNVDDPESLDASRDPIGAFRATFEDKIFKNSKYQDF